MKPLLHRGAAAVMTRRLTPEPERELPRDPVRWVRDDLNEHLWSHQRGVMRAVQEHRRVAWKACHGPGKSYSAGRLATWWIEAHRRGEAKVITTAPSGHQVRTILWGEIGRTHDRHGLAGTITRGAVPEWVIDGEVVGFGRKPADYVNAEQARTQFQGSHARYLLVILDEACGVPLWLWEAIDTLVTNEYGRLLAIGNPDDPTTQFERVCRPGSGWHVLSTSVFDTPNFTGEWVPEQLREMLPSRTWVEERRQAWGEDSPLWKSKVLGEFPEVADDVVISPRLVRIAHEVDRSGYALEPGQFGFDIARYGEDESVIYRDRGGWVRLVAAWRKADTYTSTDKARQVLAAVGGEFTRTRMVADVVGIGAGPVDTLRAEGLPVVPFNGGEKANNPDRFVNARAEAWWAFREDMEAGLIDLDPEDELLAAQLQQPKWRLDTSQRRIRLETKDEMRARGLKSPDRGDAAIMARYRGAPVGDPANVMPDDGELVSLTADLMDLQT